jgi:hypothetical protein
MPHKPEDKVLKVSITDFEVDVEEIEKTSAFHKAYNKNIKLGLSKHRARRDAYYYGVEEWIYSSGDTNIKIKLVDGNDNEIEDEELFDKTINYNL